MRRNRPFPPAHHGDSGVSPKGNFRNFRFFKSFFLSGNDILVISDALFKEFQTECGHQLANHWGTADMPQCSRRLRLWPLSTPYFVIPLVSRTELYLSTKQVAYDIAVWIQNLLFPSFNHRRNSLCNQVNGIVFYESCTNCLPIMARRNRTTKRACDEVHFITRTFCVNWVGCRLHNSHHHDGNGLINKK